MAAVSDTSSSFDGLRSPRSRRPLGSRNQSPPTSQLSHIQRSGNSSEAIPVAVPPSSEGSVHERSDNSSQDLAAIENCGGGGNAGGKTKKQAWNKPSNSSIEVSDVMGGLWPALSESAKVSPKSSSDSLSALGEGSTANQGHAVSSSPHKQNFKDGNPIMNPNPFSPRQKVGNRGDGGPNRHAGSHSPHSLETAYDTSDRASAVGVISSPGAHTQRNINRDAGSRGNLNFHQTQGANDQPRNSFKKASGGGSYARRGGAGDVPYENSFGSRGDQGRSNFQWTPHQNFSGRDFHTRQPRPGSRGFVRQGLTTPPPFFNPLHVRRYPGPIGFPDMLPPLYYVPAPPPDSLGGVLPYVVQVAPPGMLMPALDPYLRAMLIKQIDYYFSPENLCKDIFLRQKMDEQGWVPISLIANFNRVKQLTTYTPFILEAVRSSTMVEVQGDKIRKRNDWMNWLLPPPTPFSSDSAPQSPNNDALSTQMQSIGLEGTSNYKLDPRHSHDEFVVTRSSSGPLSGQIQGGLVIGTSNVDATDSQMGSGGLASVKSSIDVE